MAHLLKLTKSYSLLSLSSCAESKLSNLHFLPTSPTPSFLTSPLGIYNDRCTGNYNIINNVERKIFKNHYGISHYHRHIFDVSYISFILTSKRTRSTWNLTVTAKTIVIINASILPSPGARSFADSDILDCWSWTWRNKISPTA